MKQGDSIKFFVQALGSNGEGVAKVGENYIYTPFVLPEEYVSARVTYAKRTTVFACAKEILKPSKARVTPHCEKFGKCGGCQLQHADYSLQLSFKQDCVKQNLAKIGGLSIEVNPTVASPKQWKYRNKVQFPVGVRDGKAVLGFFKNDTHTLVPVATCPLQDEWADKMAKAFLDYANKTKTAVYDEKSHKGILRHLVGRFVDGQLLVMVVTNGEILPDWKIFVEELKKYFDDFGLFKNINTARTNVILGKRTDWLYGRKVIESNVDGIDFFLRPDSFFQVNFDVMRLIYQRVKQALRQKQIEVLVDCFSGSGVLSAGLYQAEVKEYAIEITPSSVEDANQLKQKNGLKDITNICGDVAVELPKIMSVHKDKKTAIVLDPPRKGIDKSTAQLLLDTKPNVIVYISCDSATLARDLKLLTQTNEYNIDFVQPYDMFPQTKHVESVVCLTRRLDNELPMA